MITAAAILAAVLTLVPLVRIRGRFTHTEPKAHTFGLISGLGIMAGLVLGFPEISGPPAQALAAFFLFAVFSCAWSDMPYHAIGKLPQWAGFAFLFLCARAVPAETALMCLYVPSVFVAAYGLLHQIWMRDPFNEQIAKALKNHKRTRMYSSLGNPNYVGAYLAPQVFAGLWLGLNASWWFLAPLLIIVPALVLSRCRAALVSVILGFCFVPGTWPYVIVLAFAYGLLTKFRAVKAFFSAKHRENYPSAMERIAYVKISLALIRERPLFGWGLQAFKRKIFRVQEVIRLNPRHMGEYAHNDWLEMLIEFGIFGFVLFGLFAAAVFSAGWGSYILLAGFAACIVNAALFYTLHLAVTALPLFVLAGVLSGPAGTVAVPPVYGLPLAAVVGYLAYTWCVRPLLGLYFYNKYMESEEKDIEVVKKALSYAPYNSHFLGTVAAAYHFADPVQALHLHGKGLHHYDGEVTEWSVWNNYGRAAGNAKALLLAERAFEAGLELNPEQPHLKEGLAQTREILAKLQAQAAKKSKTVKNLKTKRKKGKKK